MRRFLHGIRRPFFRTVGAHIGSCFGLELLLNDSFGEDEEGSLSPRRGVQAVDNLHKDDGVLLPLANGEDDAVNTDLQPEIKGQYNDGGGLLLPSLGDEDAANIDLQIKATRQEFEDGILPPNQCGEDEEKDFATNLDLHAPHFGQNHEEEDGKKLQTWYAYELQFGIQNATHNAIPMHDWAFAHAANFFNGKFENLNAWVMPIPRPRVKMKVEINLFYLTTGMLDPGIRVAHIDAHSWDHDGWVSTTLHPHHEFHSTSPYISSTSPNISIKASLTMDYPCPQVCHFPHLSSTSTFPLHASLSNEDEVAPYKVTQAITMPFTPLRGRKGYQGHESQFKVKMMARTGSQTKLKTKTKLMQTGLHYINKDLLDPG